MEQQLDAFVHQHGVIEARTNYQVVAIMGPQSSGKSTLMNHVVSSFLVVRPWWCKWHQCPLSSRSCATTELVLLLTV
jgi:ABC-type hemin transport system ATPase subunit